MPLEHKQGLMYLKLFRITNMTFREYYQRFRLSRTSFFHFHNTILKRILKNTTVDFLRHTRTKSYTINIALFGSERLIKSMFSIFHIKISIAFSYNKIISK